MYGSGKKVYSSINISDNLRASNQKTIQCQFCLRTFNQKAGERHIEHCEKTDRELKARVRNDSRASNGSSSFVSKIPTLAIASKLSNRSNSRMSNASGGLSNRSL